MNVRFTRTAQRDLVQIHAYISQDSPDIASRVVARLIERSRELGKTPFEGRQTDEPNARVIIAPRLRYFIFYTIVADEIHITHIRHTSRRRPRGWDRSRRGSDREHGDEDDPPRRVRPDRPPRAETTAR